MLPTPEALANTPPASPLETTATLQPQPKDSDILASYRLHDGLQPVPASSQPATAVQRDCNPSCNRQDSENTNENEGGCRVAQDSEGMSRKDDGPKQTDLKELRAEVVESDGDLEEREAIIEVDGLLDPEMPEFLRRT